MPERAEAAPARESDRAAATKAALGPGRPFEAPVRARFERGFGRPFGDVRIHDGAEGAGAAARLGATAFAAGTDVGFAAGRYRPGTPGGDALIAHELAHVEQQRGAPPGMQRAGAGDRGTLERDADAGALAALTGAPWSPRRAVFGLQLSECDPEGADYDEEGEGEAVIPTDLDSWVFEEPDGGTDADATAPPGPVTPAAPAATGPPAGEAELLDLSGVTWEAEAAKDAVLMLRGEDKKLYLLPAKGLVYRPAPPAAGAAQGTPNLASIGIPAAGHAGVYLVRTDRGAGMLVDAGGTMRGAPNVLLPGSLAWISARLGITNIAGALISHTHADHVANLESFVQQGLVTGNSVWVYPGWQSATKGPLAAAFTALRDARYTGQGFGPTWQPTQLTTQSIATTTSATLQVGGATITVYTRTADLLRYNQELAAGRTGSKYADAASMLTRIRVAGASWDFAIVGDIRGATIADLHDSLGATAFNEVFKDTRVLGGFQHHLGAVNSARDVRGMTLLLKAARSADFPLTIVVQTDAGRNASLIAQLQEAGARVVALGDVDPANPAGVKIRQGGQVEAKGAQVFEPSGAVQEARSRIETLTRAAEVLESHPGLIRVSGTTHTDMAAGLRAEAERLRGAVYERQELALGETYSTTKKADYSTRLATNTTAIQTPQGMADKVGQDSIRLLRRLQERATELQKEQEAARKFGRASPRLRQLIMEVDPAFAKAVLADEFGRATNARGQLRAQRRATVRLQQQVSLQRALTSGGVQLKGARAGVAVGLIALEIFNQVAPLVQTFVDDYRATKARDFYLFLTIGSWWQDKAVAVPVRGRRGGSDVPSEENLTASAVRRIWEDTPEKKRVREDDLEAAVKEAQPLDALWIPPLAGWTNQQQVWDVFRLWVSIHVNTFDDYAAEFRDVPNPAIRGSGPNFEEYRWEVRTATVDSDGHVVDQWEYSEELTKIMRATATAVIAGTEAQIEKEWKERKQEGPKHPSVSAPGTPTEPARSNRPTAKGRFVGGVQEVYAGYPTAYFQPTKRWVVRELERFRFWDDSPEFLVYRQAWAPDGYVWVSGADYNTRAALRAATTLLDDVPVVQIPKDVTPMYEVLPRKADYSAQEQAALDAAQAGKAFYYAYDSITGQYKGEVHFPYWGPNVGGRVLVEKEDIEEIEQ